jgi:hypothetical protein
MSYYSNPTWAKADHEIHVYAKLTKQKNVFYIIINLTQILFSENIIRANAMS